MNLNFLKTNFSQNFSQNKDWPVLLFCSGVVLFLSLYLHWVNSFHFDRPLITRDLFLFSLCALAYYAAKTAGYLQASLLTRNCCLLLLIGLIIDTALHVLPLTPFRLIDPQLVKTDHFLDFDLPTFVFWINHQYPFMSFFLGEIYHTLPCAFIPCIFILPWVSEARAKEFLVLFSLTNAIGLSLYFIFPAIGPMASYHYPLNPLENHYLNGVTQFRAQPHLFLNHFISGDISFPSFHTILALICAWVWRDFRWVFMPFSLWSVLIILSTLTTGWHYLTDVIGGILVFIISVQLWHRLKQPSLLRSAPQVGQAIAGSFLLEESPGSTGYNAS